MRRISAFTVALACAAQTAYAAVTSHDTLFTTICTDDKIIGFSWENGAWAAAMQYPSKFVVQKRDPQSRECVDAFRTGPMPGDLFNNLSVGCYTVADFGNGPGPALACSEMWSDDPGGTESLTGVTCAAVTSYEWIIFDPTGNFQYARLGGDLTDQPRDSMKDPLTMSVGKCMLGRGPGIYPPG